MAADDEPRIAVFVDFENLAIGARDMRGQQTFQIEVVLRRLLEKGRIVFKRAYCDWTRYREATKELHQQGVELIDVPHTGMSGKNSADIHLVVDALELCHAKQHIDFFALLTGDSDFSPLVAKLKEKSKDAKNNIYAYTRLTKDQLDAAVQYDKKTYPAERNKMRVVPAG